MAYLDKINVKGTEYDIQDSKAARQTEVDDLKTDLSRIGLSDDVKTSLLACFQNVAWIDAHGQDYYDALEAALYADSYPRITAVFDAGVNVIYTDDALDTLKQYLTVKYFATKESTGTVIASSDYTLSGVLTEGTSTVTVIYNDLRKSVTVPDVINFYNKYLWTTEEGTLSLITGNVTHSSSKLSISDYTTSVNRKAIVAHRGRKPYYNGNTGNLIQDVYPIPIPPNAKKIKVSCTPSNTYMYSCRLARWNGEENISFTASSWFNSGESYSFNSEVNLIIGIQLKYDADGRSFPTIPDSVTVEFMDE